MLKLILRIAAVVALLLAAVAAWWLFLDGRPAPVREDLVRMPAEFGPPPKGYPTENALIASFALGRLKLQDLGNPPPLPEGVTVEKGIEYGRVGNTPLLLDLYRPETTDTPRPAILFIHGGGWVGGDRADYTIYAQQFAAWGYVAGTISYRFSSEAKFPGCVSDAKCAVRWLRANAARLGVNPDQIAVAGGSAGGHLSMMIGYSSDVAELEGEGGHAEVSSAVQAVINLYGPTDLTAPVAQGHPSVTGLMGGAYADMTEAYRQASPLHHLDAGDPPTFIIQGTLDTIVPSSQADALAEKLKTLGVDYWYDCYDGWPHTMDMAVPVTERVQPAIRAFLEHVFGTPGTP